jgi:tripartite-type tricarboxylate transporter receptor subunit TctC
MLRLIGGAMIVAAALAASPVAAQTDYPRRAVTLIVPFAAGGPADITGRLVGEHLTRTFGQQVVVENVVGAGGTTGVTRGARASADGYTLTLGHMGTHAAAVPLYPNLAYKPDTDFAPVGLVVEQPMVLVTRKDFPADDLKQFAGYVKANVDKINMAHAGVGSVSYTSCLLLNSLIGIKPTAVPFSGTLPAMMAMIGGQVDYLCDTIIGVVQQLQGGNVKGLALATGRRSPSLPDVPSAPEAGMPEFQAAPFYGVFAPKGTPQPILDKLTDALDRMLDDEAMRRRLLALGCEIPDKDRRGQQALALLVKSEIARWTQVIRAAGPLN